MSEVVIEARGLTKSFRDRTIAVQDLDFQVRRGTVYGLMGRNGSGKTTALRLLLGLLQADRGESKVLGWNFWEAPRTIRRCVAYASQNQQLPGSMTLDELSRCLAHLNEKWDAAYAKTLANRWQIAWKQQVRSLSSGQQRQAAILVAFASRPEVLILDEPSAGFDVVARRQLSNTIVEALNETDGCTVLLSTHIVSDIERLADEVGIIHRGKMEMSLPSEVIAGEFRRIQIVFNRNQIPADFMITGSLVVRQEGVLITAIVRWTNPDEEEALRESIDGILQIFPLTLEEIFVELFGGEERRALVNRAGLFQPGGVAQP